MAKEYENDFIRLLPVLQNHANIQELQFAADIDHLRLESIGDGNLNYVIRVQDADKKESVIIKHAPPFVKCLGPEHPLCPSRGDVEYRAMKLFHQLAPGSIPKPYFYDKDTSLICMEDLKVYKRLRDELIDRKCSKKVIQKVARDLATVHRGTHIATVGDGTFKEMQQEFKDSELVSLTEQYIFTKPFLRDDPTNRSTESVKQHGDDIVYGNPDVISAAGKMKSVFLQKKECLVHGDLHTESIMVCGDDSKIIDLEFAYMGPPSFDVGILIANYIFSYYCHMSNPEDHERRREFAYSMIEMCKLTVNTYLEHMTCHHGDRETYLNKLQSEMAGFAGCEIVRRILGTAHIRDLEGSDHANIDALGAGVRLLLAHERIHSIDRLLVVALMLA